MKNLNLKSQSKTMTKIKTLLILIAILVIREPLFAQSIDKPTKKEALEFIKNNIIYFNLNNKAGNYTANINGDFLFVTNMVMRVKVNLNKIEYVDPHIEVTGYVAGKKGEDYELNWLVIDAKDNTVEQYEFSDGSIYYDRSFRIYFSKKNYKWVKRVEKAFNILGEWNRKEDVNSKF